MKRGKYALQIAKYNHEIEKLEEKDDSDDKKLIGFSIPNEEIEDDEYDDL